MRQWQCLSKLRFFFFLQVYESDCLLRVDVGTGINCINKPYTFSSVSHTNWHALFYKNFVSLELEIIEFQRCSLKQHFAYKTDFVFVYKTSTVPWLLYHFITTALNQQWRQNKLQRFFFSTYFRTSQNLDVYLRELFGTSKIQSWGSCFCS